ILEMYGVNQEPTHPYAVNCLLARRMVERGVRFVMLAHASWDDHQELDRKLVIWGGEFGRTPMGQFERLDEAVGRDHHPNCFSMWLAGGGIKGGQVVGKTDDLGLNVAEDKVHI